MSKYFKKYSEYAPGIPVKNLKTAIPNTSKIQQWEFVVQEHISNIKGHHLDLRLAPPMGPGFSWVVPEIPLPGNKTYAHRVDNHSVDYFDFEGKIKKGYGAGIVKQIYRGKVDVLHSDKNKITFYWYGNTGTEVNKFTLFNPYGGDEWIFLNHTKTKKLDIYKNIEPLKYKDLSGKYIKQEGDFETPKIDGASSVVVLIGGKTPVVFSRRVSKKTGEQIEYTPKIPKLLETRVPKNFGTTVLRAEIFALDKNSKEVPNRILGGMLNSSVQKSRATQKMMGAPLRVAAYDVVKYKGKKVDNLPISEKYELIKKISNIYPIIENPLQLNKTTPFTEGKVVWRNKIPLKIKNKKDFDVYVRGIFPSLINGRAGGIIYSLTKTGPIVGRVGSGFTHNELRNMFSNPQKYIGKVAKISAQEQHPSGAYRSPSFISWHLDK